MEEFWSGREAFNLSKTPNISDKYVFRFIFSSSLKISTWSLLLLSLWEIIVFLLGNSTHLLQFLCDVDIWSSYKVVILFIQRLFCSRTCWKFLIFNNRYFNGKLHHLFQTRGWVSCNQVLTMDFTVCSKRHLVAWHLLIFETRTYVPK